MCTAYLYGQVYGCSAVSMKAPPHPFSYGVVCGVVVVGQFVFDGFFFFFMLFSLSQQKCTFILSFFSFLNFNPWIF